MPPLPQAERDALPRAQLWLRVLKVALPPLALVLSVLGSIIGGIAAPTEAASMGALGSILVVALARRLTLAGAARRDARPPRASRRWCCSS